MEDRIRNNIYELINTVLNDEKLRKDTDNGKLYRDEPILRPASQLPRPVKIKSAIPEEIKQMKQLAYSDGLIWQPRERIFYEQALLMADYEDDFEYSGNFEMYYPVYTSMSVEQLRGYFSWRTHLRRGETVDVIKPYIFMHIYEILNGIGINDHEEGYRRLTDFRERFSSIPVIVKYLNNWIKDYIIYNALPKELLKSVTENNYANMSVLINYREKDDTELFEAIKGLSAYDIERSTFFKAYPDDFKYVSCAVYRKYADYYAEHNDKSLFEKQFGFRISCAYRMFASAIFYDVRSNIDREYIIDELQKYICHSGKWYADMYYAEHKNKQLGELMRTVDYLMRVDYGFRHKLGICTSTQLESKLIEDEIKYLSVRKKQEESAKIEIDVTKLGEIRTASDITRDKLIVDEPEYESEDSKEIEETKTEENNDIPLNNTEIGFVHCLLYGGDYAASAKKAGSMPLIIADSVNEKLFDLFGDTVIDISGGEISIIEDYEDELKGLIHK